MAELVVQDLDEDVIAKLQLRAFRQGHSLEAEVRDILRTAVRNEEIDRSPLGSRIAAHFAGIGLDEDIPKLRGQPSRRQSSMIDGRMGLLRVATGERHA